MLKLRKLVLPVRAFSTKRDKKFYNKNVKKVKNYQVMETKNTNEANPNPGIGNRLKMFEEDEVAAKISASHEFEDLQEDINEFEADFMNLGSSHRMHEKERELQKQKLKTKITISKYLKEVEPSFLTFAEKEEIKSLHERLPHEWSIEKLSESYPALPATIKKVLHAKWSPKNVETVLRYDEKVIHNWEAFRAGELSVSPKMKKHLENFKDRRIVQTNREELAKQFVPPKMELPKPKSTMFSTIAQNFLIQGKKTRTDNKSQNMKNRSKQKYFEENEDYEEEVNFNFESKPEKRVFESNKDFHVSPNFKGKNKQRNVKKDEEIEDLGDEFFKSEINFQEKKALFVSSGNLNVENLDPEEIRNSGFKSKSLKANGKSSDKKRNSEENEDTKNVENLTFGEYQNTEADSVRKENQMTLMSQNSEERDPQGKNTYLAPEDDSFVRNRNSDFKNRSSEAIGNPRYKKRNFEENEDTKKVRSLTIRESQNNNDDSTRKKNKMTLLSRNLEAKDPRGKDAHLTFEEFLIEKVGRTKDSSSPEDIVLKETYRKHMEEVEFGSKAARFRESETEEDFNSESTFESEESAIERNISSVSLKEGRGAESRISTRRTRENELSDFRNSQTDLTSKQKESELSFSVGISSADTYVKEWIKRGDDLDDDPPNIQIPKHRYKEGMTYRVKNCYYDDDGEFLYKVPGLHN